MGTKLVQSIPNRFRERHRNSVAALPQDFDKAIHIGSVLLIKRMQEGEDAGMKVYVHIIFLYYTTASPPPPTVRGCSIPCSTFPLSSLCLVVHYCICKICL